MPSYRFNLPKNAIRAKVDDLITDAATYQIAGLENEDAMYIMLKYNGRSVTK